MQELILVSILKRVITHVFESMLQCKTGLFALLSLLVFKDVNGKIIIDNDAGSDDAIAIFMALLYEKYFDGNSLNVKPKEVKSCIASSPKLVGLTTGSGNTDEDKVYVNNQRILKVAKRQDVPIFRGSKNSLVIAPPSVRFKYGVDGLGDNDDMTDTEGLVPPQNQKAVEALIELSKIHEGNLTVITIGTLTNVALAIKIDHEFLKRLNHLYIGAGKIHDENSKPEFNAFMDVEAYHIVTQHAEPNKVTIYPYSTTKNYLNFDKEWRLNIFGAIDTDIVRALNKYERISLNKSESWISVDPSVLAVVLKPNLVEEYKYSKNKIILCGQERGITTHELVEKKEDANVRVIHKVKHDEYKQFLIDVFSAELDVEKDNHLITRK